MVTNVWVQSNIDKLACGHYDKSVQEHLAATINNALAHLLAKASEADRRILQLILERDDWRERANQKFAMRKELEEILGVGDTYDETEFKNTVKFLKSMKAKAGAADKLAEALQEIKNVGGSGECSINKCDGCKFEIGEIDNIAEEAIAAYAASARPGE